MYGTDNISKSHRYSCDEQSASALLDVGITGDRETANHKGITISDYRFEEEKHEIRKRAIDPLAWLWQIPTLYGFCAVAANFNSALGVKIGSKLTGPVNVKLKPLYLKTIKPTMSLKVKALYCPPAAVTAWGLGTLLGLIPGTG